MKTRIITCDIKPSEFIRGCHRITIDGYVNSNRFYVVHDCDYIPTPDEIKQIYKDEALKYRPQWEPE